MSTSPVGPKNIEKLVRRLHPMLATDTTGVFKKILADVTNMPKSALTVEGIFFLTNNGKLNEEMIEKIDETMERMKSVEKIVTTIMSLRTPALIEEAKDLSPIKKEIALTALVEIDFERYDRKLAEVPASEKENFIKKFYKKTMIKVMDLYMAEVTAREKSAYVEEIESEIPFKTIKRHAGDEFMSVLKVVLETAPDRTLNDDIIETCRRIDKTTENMDRKTRQKIYWKTVHTYIQARKCIAALAEEFILPDEKLNTKYVEKTEMFSIKDENIILDKMGANSFIDVSKWKKTWKEQNRILLSTAKASIPNLEGRLLKYTSLHVMGGGKVCVNIDMRFLSVIYQPVKALVIQHEMLKEHFEKGKGANAN